LQNLVLKDLEIMLSCQ